MSDLSRREFLKYLGIGALGFVARPKLLSALERRLPFTDDASDVVQCYDVNATSGNTINEPVVQVMVDESVKALTGQSTVGEAWKSLFPGITTSSVIGIKVNCINSSLPTHPAVVRCIINGLAQMDLGGTLFKKNNVIVWDRTNSELTASGYSIYTGTDPDTARCFGTNQSGVGYDTTKPLNVGGVSQNPSKIISQMCEFIINAAVLKTHSQGVVTLTLKNHYGSVHSPSSLSHSNSCTPSVPALSAQIRDVLTPTGKQKLFFIDGLFGLYSGGPGGSPNFNPKLILMSRDTVACDYQGQNVINAERQRRSLTPVNCAHITMAAQSPYNLGTTDVNLIEINNPTGIAEPGRLPNSAGFVVVPDPFRGRATVSFSLPVASPVSIELLNQSGAVTASVFRGELGRGQHRIAVVTGNRLAGGTYFMRVASRAGTRVRKVTVLN
ncbi:MAG: DUF362 domain-containing protein [candidate division WOR-3 bacterium]